MTNRHQLKEAISCSLLAVCAALVATPSTAKEAEQSPYVGITSGGQIGAPDRIASDQHRKVVTSAEISNEDDILNANFALDLTVTSRATDSEENGVSFKSMKLFNFSVKASVPINPSEEGSLVDFKTFGNDGKITVGANFYRSKLVSGFSTMPDIGKFAITCVALASNDWMKGRNSTTRAADLQQIEAVQASFKKNIDGELPVSTSLSRLPKLEDGKDFGQFAFDTCRAQGGTAGVENDLDYAKIFGVQTFGQEGYYAWRKKYLAPQSSVFIGAEASIGYNRFSVLDRTALNVGVKDRIGFDINGRIGKVWGQSGWVFLASGGYTRSYKPKDVAEVCGPPDLSGNTTCVSGQDGLPDREETAYASVSLRKVLLRNKNGQPILGVRPSVTYVFEDKAWQFELPVYLQRSDDGGLDAGVRAIFNTGSDKFGLGAFVGVPF